jgi:hypothetical protein
VTRRWLGAAALVLVAAACNSDDDDAAETSVSVETTTESTSPPATEPPETTAPPAPTSTTAGETTTTVDEEALKAQIAEDYLRSWELRRELTANPTLEGLSEKLAQISAPGSDDAENFRTFINELVSLGERVIPGTPDEFRIDVEDVELVGGPPNSEGVITICFVSNSVRVDASGNVVSDLGIVATRSEDHVVTTPNGWLPDRGLEDTWQGLGVTECPAS